MNKLQRLLLGIMLTIDALLLLFPPHWYMARYASPGRPAGNYWFLSAGRIDFAMLAYEILVVSVVVAPPGAVVVPPALGNKGRRRDGHLRRHVARRPLAV